MIYIPALLVAEVSLAVVVMALMVATNTSVFDSSASLVALIVDIKNEDYWW